MIKSVHDYHICDLLKTDANFYYKIPKYQRAYTWNQYHWKALYDDLMENGNEYFIGSIICINTADDSIGYQCLEVVDGQQRLTTITLFLAALYSKFQKWEEIVKNDEDTYDDYRALKKSLVCSGSKENGLILVPQSEGHNSADYSYAMSLLGLTKGKKEKNYGNRKIAKCYKYFSERIDNDIYGLNEVDALKEIRKIYATLKSALLVKIEVSNSSEAYMLFESLNNRGASLTPIELMKNTVLARAEQSGLSTDDCYDKWQELLENISDDYATQERFFRHYYNAYKNKINAQFRKENEKKKDVLGNVATKSNLLNIYEALIKRNLTDFLTEITQCGKVYSMFLLLNEDDCRFQKELSSLYRVQGTPSYLLLLYLVREQAALHLEDKTIAETIKLMTTFFVRRNLTDIPNTQDVTRIFMSIIGDIEDKSLKGTAIYNHIYTTLQSRSASDDLFKEKLSGDIYEDNVGITRFLLCELAESYMTKETFKDLWEQEEQGKNGKKVYVWTIEHIFPEGEKVPSDWVDMIANGDKELAQDYRDRYVHKLGNLTITGFNSKLSNMSFDRKKERKNDEGNYIGYKNGLGINAEIAQKDSWTIEDITDRTERLVNKLLAKYKL